MGMSIRNVKRIDITKLMSMLCRTIHEAEGPCENQYTSCLAHVNLRICDISHMVTKATEKQREPIKVSQKGDGLEETWKWACPSCIRDIAYGWKFCPECGQEMDWGEGQIKNILIRRKKPITLNS